MADPIQAAIKVVTPDVPELIFKAKTTDEATRSQVELLLPPGAGVSSLVVEAPPESAAGFIRRERVTIPSPTPPTAPPEQRGLRGDRTLSRFDFRDGPEAAPVPPAGEVRRVSVPLSPLPAAPVPPAGGPGGLPALADWCEKHLA